MKTVQDYRDLGLVFVDGDKGYKHIIESFAWRNNEGVKPGYKGLIHAMFENGSIIQDVADSLSWGGSFNPIIKWRPVVFQSESDDAQNKLSGEIFSAMASVGLTSKKFCDALTEAYKPKFTIKEETPKTITVNIEGCDHLIASRTPTASPKEDKPMKPVYTAEMHAKGELPPIGADCILIIDSEPRQARVTYIGKSLGVCSNIDDGAEYAFLLGEASFKPIIKTIKVNGFDAPAPTSEAPEVGSVCFVASINNQAFFYSIYWETISCNKTALSRGLIHSTKSAAIAHAKAMLGIDPNESN